MMKYENEANNLDKISAYIRSDMVAGLNSKLW